MSTSQLDFILAHKHSSRHRPELMASRVCGCFYCLATFPADEIKRWIDDNIDPSTPKENGQTARCPRCGIDSVIGDASGYAITDELLRQMHEHWFS
jgi:hypothetical protein